MYLKQLIEDVKHDVPYWIIIAAVVFATGGALL